MDNIDILGKELCTGCLSCYNVCPHSSIEAKIDSEGFYGPSINYNTCTNCGKCKNVCPELNPIENKNYTKPNCFSVTTSDEIRSISTSGGVFTILANYILENGGFICGAAFNDTFQVEHILINNKKDLDKLRRSKYLQSYTSNIYSEIKKILDKNMEVLFSGTPCQVAGLNSFLGREYKNLLTIDIICHGVPSPAVWKKYLDEEFKDKKIESINFRNKNNGWENSGLYIEFKDGSKYYGSKNDDVYYISFLQNYSLKKSCGACRYACTPRIGDMTLGDFWGVNNYNTALNDDKGLSLLLINNEKGNKIVECVKSFFINIDEIPIEAALPYQLNLREPSKLNKDRDKFFDIIKNNSLKKTIDFLFYDKSDCAILNLWWSNNYGAILTCYALQEAIIDLGFTVQIIQFIPEKNYNNNFKNKMSDLFSEKYLNLNNDIYTKDKDLIKLNKIADTFVVGSDQVWRFEWGGLTYFFDFINDNKKKLAYASSFGVDTFTADEKSRLLVEFYLNRFNDISVREQDGVDICKNTFGIDATFVLDPVFLLDKIYYDNILDKSELNPEPYILSYILGDTAKSIQVENCLKEKLKLKVIRIEKTESVADWLFYFKNAKYIITDSYHGACFSIIFNKNFICLENDFGGNSRFNSLFKMLDIESRLLFYSQKINSSIFDKNIDYEKINEIINEEKNHSILWLKNALEKKIKDTSIENRLIRSLIIENNIIKNKLNILISIFAWFIPIRKWRDSFRNKFE